MSERFNNAMKALIKGFFDGTLESRDCGKCAVGNMVAYCNNEKIASKETNPHPYGGWYNVICFMTDSLAEAQKLCKSTGYSVKEVIEIEKAFESNTSDRRLPDSELAADQFNGLMAVVEVLCKIEGIESDTYKKEFNYLIEDNKLIKA